MRTALRSVLAILGGSAILIALSILFTGAAPTAALAERAFSLLTGWRGPPSPPWPPTMDNELRFYAALWGAYGILLLLAARNISGWSRHIPWLAAVFFVGGLGRLLSYFSLGPPHPVFTTLMVVELSLPVALMGLWLGACGGWSHVTDPQDVSPIR